MAKKILIVEDEDVLLNILKEKLTKAQYIVETARDGEEGLGKMKEFEPDLILLDIVMPKLDGFGVLRAMVEDPVLKEIPVIIISNSGQPVEIEAAQQLGADDYIIKADFSPEEVMEKVRKHLGEGNLSPASENNLIVEKGKKEA